MRIFFDEMDRVRAFKHAELRVLESIATGKKDRFYARDATELEKQMMEVRGVLAELAVIKWLGYSNGPRLNVYHELADVGADVEVRNASVANYGLRIRQRDDLTRRFILTYTNDTCVNLMGWCWGHEAAIDQYVQADGTWVVPQVKLHFMETFKK